MSSRGDLFALDPVRESTDDIPEGVRRVLEHRLARLPQACVEMLTAAAVVGRPVGRELLARANGGSSELLTGHIDSAVRAGVLTPPSGPTGPYAFTHDLFRETVYAAIAPSQLAGMHRRVADALAAPSHADARAVGSVDTGHLRRRRVTARGRMCPGGDR